MWLENISQSKSHAAKCPTCGGAVQRRFYGEMYAGSFIQDGKRVEIRRVPNEGYTDPVYLDPLTQYFDGGLYRMYPSERYLSRGGRTLHRDVWSSAFGAIPKDCHIHHKDSDTINNSLSNLECMPKSEHLSQSSGKRRRPRNPGDWFSPEARARATEWHRSEEGRLWHSRHAKRSKSWQKWQREDKPCAFCGQVVSMLVRKSGNAQKYCSNNCKAAHYRRRRAAQ